MDILVETCLDDLYLLLFQEHKVLDKVLVKNLREKSEKLPALFNKLLHKNNLDVQDLNRFYVTRGPGSFMGVRAGLLFIQTLAGVLHKEVYACDTLQFLQTRAGQDVFINGRGGTFYSLVGGRYQLLTGSFCATSIDYDFIENNLAWVVGHFQAINPFENNALYMKEPQIG